MLSPEKLNDLRKRVLANEEYSQEELAQAIKQEIAARLSSFEAPKAKSKAKPVDLDDLI